MAYRDPKSKKAYTEKYNASPEGRITRAANQKKWREEHPERDRELHRNAKLKNKYKITSAEYEELLIKQNGVCAICRRPETVIKNGKVARLSVDHDHNTKKVRGLLCQTCNVMLGCAYDDVAMLLLAVDYLKGYLT